MPELQRTSISLSLFKPQVIVDAVEGCWFAIISDGTARVEVTEWPLWDCQFLVDAQTVLRIELYTADDQGQFWRNECNKFSEVYIPAAKVIRGHGGVFRTWLGLQRGYFTMDEVSFQAGLPTAMERYEASLSLAKCLLSPKLCISVLSAGAAALEHPSTAMALDGIVEERGRGPECDAMLRQSVVQHSTIITALNRQMYTLWLKGRIVSGDKLNSNDKFTAYLIDANVEDSSPFAGFCEYEKHGDADSVARLQEEVSRLTESVVTTSARLDESERLKARYRKRLTELTGERFEEDDCVAFDEADFVSIQALQREARHLQEKLQAERARSGAAQKDLEALRSSGAGKWTESKSDELKRRHSDELRQLSRIHAVEVESFRAAEHEQRLLGQELQRKSDSLAQDALRKQAQVTILHDELGELTARLAEAWNNQDQPPNVSVDDHPLARHALSFAELEASRREVDELRQQLLCSDHMSASISNGVPSSIPPESCGFDESIITRAQAVVQELQSDTAARPSERELVLCSEVNRLASFAMELRKEREGARITCADLGRRRDIAERRAADLQREVDQAAGEAMLTASTILDKESQELALRQEVRSLSSRFVELQESLSSSSLETPGSQVAMDATKAELETKVKVSNEAWLRQQDLSESARAEVESLRGALKTRTLEQKEEVLELRANLQKEKQISKEQADSHVEALQQRDQQHGRQLGAIYAELALETQARAEMERLMGESQQVEFHRCEQAAKMIAKEREDRLRCEMQDLEDANIAMSQQTQRQFDDFASLQERFNREILSFRKEQYMHEDGSTSFSKLQQANRILQNEVKELRVELNAERSRRREPAEARVARQASSKSLASSTSGGTPATPHVRVRPIEGVWGIEPAMSALSVKPSTTQRVASGRQLVPAIAVPRVGNNGERLAHR